MAALVALCLSLPVRAEAIGLNDLIENALENDGKIVTVEGEAIGEALERGDYSWVNINDGTNAIGVWLKTDDAKKLTFFGDYKHIGDKVRVIGVFSRDCAEHGGDIDIHAESFVVLSKGWTVSEDIPREKIAFAVILAVFSLSSALLYYKKYYK